MAAAAMPLLALLAQASECPANAEGGAARALLVEGVVEQIGRRPDLLSAAVCVKLLSFRSDHNEAVRRVVASCVERAAKRDPSTSLLTHEAMLAWISDRSGAVQRRAVLAVDASYRWALSQAAGITSGGALLTRTDAAAVWRSVSLAKDRTAALLDRGDTSDAGAWRGICADAAWWFNVI